MECLHPASIVTTKLNLAGVLPAVVYWRTVLFLDDAMALHIRRHATAAAFLQGAAPWLLQNEAEHNLILGLARSLTTSTDRYETPLYFATAEQDGAVVGCAWRTPPYKVGLTRMPEEAAQRLAEDVAQVFETVPAVLGPKPPVQHFAEAWSRKKGVRAEPGMLQRIYELTEVIWPVQTPPGTMRTATPEDEDLITAWISAFGEEAAIQNAHPRRLAQRLIEQKAGVLWWVDKKPVTMAAATGSTPRSARIGYVYTPPEFRRQGYATACTAALSQQLLDDGRAFCVLYTNLANPTSNSIYQRIGYRPVCDVMDYDFRET